MKTLLIIALLAAPVYGATNEEIEAQIISLQSTLEEQKADSTVTVLDALVQGNADYATLKGAGVTIVNQPHTNGNYDAVWVGVDFPLSSATAADSTKINLALSILKAQHKAQDCGVDGRVRLRKDRLSAANETLKLIFD
jgi:hypothetical protein|tara:strand:- start:21 stop:437 length:417 start_codon:yes stop_codon:yes gene_type:complete